MCFSTPTAGCKPCNSPLIWIEEPMLAAPLVRGAVAVAVVTTVRTGSGLVA